MNRLAHRAYRLRSTLVPALAGLASGLLVTTGVASAAGPSFSVAPIRLDIEATPGRPYTDAIEINNEAREGARIKVYAEDWKLERDGAVTFTKTGTGRRSASTWIRLNPTEFDLPGLQTVDVRFTVTVPKGAPAGGYRAAIVVEQVPRPTPGQDAKKEVAIRARIASVLYVRVGDAAPDAKLNAVTFRREPNGQRSIYLAVDNTGAVHFRTRGRVTLVDPKTGKTAYRLEIPDVPLLPESGRDVRVDVPPEVKPGAYQSRTELEIGRKEIYVQEGALRID